VSDAALNARLARVVGADPEGFEAIRDDARCRALMDRYDVDLSWSEGVWCAQITAPDGRPHEEEDRLATRAAVKVILAAHDR
jgi:hypothetical protein